MAESKNKALEYCAMRDRYPMTENMLGGGYVVDKELGNFLSIGFTTENEVFKTRGYCCNDGAPDLLHACVCALLDGIGDMPLMKTLELQPSFIWDALCGGGKPDEMTARFSEMALSALYQAFGGYVGFRDDKGASNER